jgi:5'-nucleotidase
VNVTKRVLVTNDDGIDSEGIRVLTAMLVEHGYEPIVIAPDSDYSGAGTSIIGKGVSSINAGQRELAYEKRVLAEAPDVEAYAVAAPPAMCTLLSMRGAFGQRPDLVASGINLGLNTGPAVRHSGTVAAALTAAGFGVPALAISAEHPCDGSDTPLRYDTAAAIAMQLLAVLPGSRHQVLNLNVPWCSLDEIAGVQAATVSTVTNFYSQVEERTDSVLKIGFAVSDNAVPAGSDSALVTAGFAAVSSLVGIGTTECGDLITRLAETAA